MKSYSSKYFIYLCITIICICCAPKVFIYERNTDEISERFIVSFSKKQFEYFADSSNLAYHAIGKTEINKDILQFEFPEHAEERILSPFKKGYFKLLKLSPSDSFEIDVNVFSVTYGYQKLSPSRHFKPNFVILSFKDSSIIQKIPFPRFRYNEEADSIFLKTDMPGFFDQYIIIPERGKYQLSLYAQSPQTLEFYETTTVSCNLVVSKPTFSTKITSTRNDSILRFKSLDSPQIEYKIKLK